MKNNLINQESQQLELLDILNIISFYIQIRNLGANLTRADKQDLMYEVDNRTEKILNEINEHLKIQDYKLDKILSKLEALEEDEKENNFCCRIFYLLDGKA